MARISLLVAAVLLASAAPPALAREPLRDRPFTVIAVVDSGIDPYHEEFRRPEMKAHPSTYIEGFPRSTPALELTFDADQYGNALSADREKWESVEPNRLYWIPGTNIIGAIGPFDVRDITGVGEPFPPPDEYEFMDHFGHGTAVASLAGGATYGPDAPNTLIVAVRGFERGLEWAATQPWIDVITNSWWNVDLENHRYGADASRLAVEKGKVVCFASGNYSHPQLYTATQGPSWIVSVGAASASTRGEHYYTDYPNDVLGLAGVPAAKFQSFDEQEPNFAGTSAAAPNVCGLIAKTISEARSVAGDNVAGTKRGALVRGTKLDGYLHDGKLTRVEVEDAILATAVPAQSSAPGPQDQYSIPALPAVHFIRGGYGIVDEKSQRDALAVIVGQKKRPERFLEDTWLAATDAIRDAIWGEDP